MPRSSGTEMPQPQQRRQSPRAPLNLKSTSSESNGTAHTHYRRSSSKPEGNHRRSPRSPLQEIPSVNQKKRGTRVADLETKLGHAKEELRKLKEQLASAEAAKKDAQHELEETKKIMPCAEADGGEQAEEEHPSCTETQKSTQEKDDKKEQPTDAPPPVEDGETQAGPLETPKEGDEEAHVVVVVAKEMVPKEKNESSGEEEPKEAGAPVTPQAEPEAPQMIMEPEENETEVFPETKVPENAELVECCLAESAGLKKQLSEAEVVERCLAENAVLKRQLSDAEGKAAAALVREEEMALRLSLAGVELEKAMSMAGQLREQLEAAEAAKGSLEAEMRTMKVQTEQWRKAAEAAAAVLSGSTAEVRVPMAGTERRGSTDEYMGGAGGGFSGLWSPLAAVEPEDGLAVGRRKGSGGGIRVFGELWKKRGGPQQHHRI